MNLAQWTGPSETKTTRVSRCQKTASSGLYGAREDNKRQTLTIRVGATPSGLISNPPPSIPPFLCRTPFLPQPFQFILAWYRYRNMLDCISPWLVSYPCGMSVQVISCRLIHVQSIIPSSLFLAVCCRWTCLQDNSHSVFFFIWCL